MKWFHFYSKCDNFGTGLNQMIELQTGNITKKKKERFGT
jgi:hypothetical protein